MREHAEHLGEVRVHLLQLPSIGAVGRLLLVGVRRVLLRHDPLRGALEQRQVRDFVDHGRHDLHAGRSAPDDAEARPGDRHRVIPTGTVETGAGELTEPVDVGVARMVQHARGGDDDVDHVVAAGRGLEVPTTVDELAADDTFTEAGVFGETVVGRDPFEVSPDLVAR